MANMLDVEARMTIKSLAERGHSNRAIARLLGVHEHAVRYHRHRQDAGVSDGRARHPRLAEGFAAGGRCSATSRRTTPGPAPGRGSARTVPC